MDVQSMTNCFTVVPNDYDWIKLSNIYYEHYFMLFADEDDYNILIVINELLLFVESAATTNLFMTLKNMFYFYAGKFNLIDEYGLIRKDLYIGPFNANYYESITNNTETMLIKMI